MPDNAPKIAIALGLASLAMMQGCGQCVHAARPCVQTSCDSRRPPAHPFWPPLAPRWSERDLRPGEMYGADAGPPPVSRSYGRPADPPRIAAIGAGSTSALVFSGFSSDPSAQPERTRNDAALSPRPDTPLLASAEWPERERASLAHPRYIYLNNRPDQLLFFENESRYRSGGVYGHTRAAPSISEQGVWGFWR